MKLLFNNDSSWKGSIKYFVSSFSFQDKDILNIDRFGRIISFISGNGSEKKVTYKKGLNGTWLGIKRQSNNSERIRYTLSSQQIIDLYQEITEFSQTLVHQLVDQDSIKITIDQNDRNGFYSKHEIMDYWIKVLKEINIRQNEQDEQKFSTIYSNIGILPPDRYGSLVLQITIGCVYNKCVFCSLYAGITYRHKDPIEFARHISDIDAFMGESLGRFHSLFLGDANALTIPFEDLLDMFKLLNNHYTFSSSKINLLEKHKPIFEGIYSFLDVFTGFKLTADHFNQLKSLNLKMVYLGIESGSKSVLKLYNKPNTYEKIRQLSQALHQAKIGIAVIFLVGAGGKTYEKEHVQESINLIKQLNLTSDDIIYLSKLNINEDSSFNQIMIQNNVKALNENELEKQFNIFKTELLNFYVDNSLTSKPIITKYEITDFIY